MLNKTSPANMKKRKPRRRVSESRETCTHVWYICVAPVEHMQPSKSLLVLCSLYRTIGSNGIVADNEIQDGTGSLVPRPPTPPVLIVFAYYKTGP